MVFTSGKLVQILLTIDKSKVLLEELLFKTIPNLEDKSKSK